MKIRTDGQFQDAIDEEFAWRLKEIANLRESIRVSNSTNRRTLLRAGSALLYAHWEGFVKNASEIYLNLIANKKIIYSDLKICFVALGLKGQITLLDQSGKPDSSSAALDFILNQLDKPAKLQSKGVIDTQSNLSSAVFQSIAGWVGIDAEPYVARENFIDVSLVKRRNEVAHGEQVDVDLESYTTLSNEVVKLLRDFKTDLENAVSLKAYLKAKAFGK